MDARCQVPSPRCMPARTPRAVRCARRACALPGQAPSSARAGGVGRARGGAHARGHDLITRTPFFRAFWGHARAPPARARTMGSPPGGTYHLPSSAATKFRERGAVHMPSGARVVSQAVSEAVSRARVVSQAVSEAVSRARLVSQAVSEAVSRARLVSQAVSEAVSRARVVSQPVSCERRRAGGRRAGRARSSQERNDSRAGRWDRRRGRTKCVHIPTEGRDPAVSCHLDRRCPRASRATTTLCSTLSWSVTRRL